MLPVVYHKDASGQRPLNKYFMPTLRILRLAARLRVRSCSYKLITSPSCLEENQIHVVESQDFLILLPVLLFFFSLLFGSLFFSFLVLFHLEQLTEILIFKGAGEKVY